MIGMRSSGPVQGVHSAAVMAGHITIFSPCCIFMYKNFMLLI